jgi:hypothetical protein
MAEPIKAHVTYNMDDRKMDDRRAN